MDKIYKHQEIENKWYTFWENGGYFKPKKDPAKKPFTIILPPPNANADLHVGHAMYVVEDIMTRYHRMKGDPTLWLSGADHAGFETQFVFEKHLAKQDKSRFDYPRETLYQMIWDFVQKNRGTMENQLRRLGFSLDWSRNIFTLDPKIVSIVYKTFKKLYDDGIVYRSERLVNYCTKDGTSFSDLEVLDQEVEGILYHINFPLEKGGHIQIATTRPETLLGDVAVMVNPQDKRYKKLIGEYVILPITGRKVPIISDTYVDMKFGTGAVKVTPNHDFNDFEIAKKHNLYYPPVIGFDGKIMNTKTDYDGLRVGPARQKMLEDPRIKNLIVLQKKHQMIVKTCYKCGRTLEPLPLPQWYVKIKPLSAKAMSAIKKKQITFVPKRFEKTAIQWLTNFHDWNISRQIVWGIRIPAWKCLDCSKDQNESWIVTTGEPPTSCPTCSGNKLQQDTDTFDTWFSSGQWPFATLQATEYQGDFDYFYPTSVMETGYDILPWWVCRMMMLGIYMTDTIPFKTVYLHGLVRDGKGQKMSKSKGNVINPLLMCDQYGTDALRMALMFGSAAGNDLALAEDKIRGMRNFANKLWNIGRFISMNFEQYSANKKIVKPFDVRMDRKLLHPEEKQYLTKLALLTTTVTKNIEEFKFDQAANQLYEFIWHEFADNYIEASKERLHSFDVDTLSVMNYIYITLLTLLHPFMPFITEEIVTQISQETKPPLIISSWPTP